MIKIVLACSAGMSTSLLVNKMKKSAADNKLEIDIKAISVSNVTGNCEGIDILLLGPQVKYLEEQLKKEADGKFPVLTINTQKYGMMDGLGVLKDTIIAIKDFRASK